MFTSVPPFPSSGGTVQAPPGVRQYLVTHGWYAETTHPTHGPLFTYAESSSEHGYFTWEQALAYTMWKRLHLGAV